MRTGHTGTAKYFFIKCSAVQLIRRHSNLIKRTKLARFAERFYFVVGEPKTQPLFVEMRFVEVLGHPQHSTHKVSTYFNGRFANASRKFRRFFENQYPNPWILPQQQIRRRPAGKRASYDHDVVEIGVFGWRRIRLGFHVTNVLVVPPGQRHVKHALISFRNSLRCVALNFDYSAPLWHVDNRFYPIANRTR